MALNNFLLVLLLFSSEKYQWSRTQNKKELFNVTASVAQEKRTVKLQKMYNGMNYYVPV